MKIQTLIMITIQASIFMTVFSFGLNSSLDDVLYVVRRPSLLARSLLSMNIIMPLFAAVIITLFDFHPAVKIALVALAVSPVPPLLPQRELKAAGTASYAYGLLFTAALIAIVFVPLAMELLARLFHFADRTSPAVVARLNAEMQKFQQTDEFRALLVKFGMEPWAPNTAAEFAAIVKNDVGRWAGVVKSAGLRVD